MSELWRLSAAELASLIRKREVSAVQGAQSALARLDAVNSRINAVVDHRPEDALSQAAALDQRLARGEDPGPLAGVPVTVKVNVDQAGYATTNGVTLQKDVIAQANNPVVDNLLRAGAVVLGRTNTPAFSLRWFTSNQLHGDTRNPRNAALTPGGSSGRRRGRGGRHRSYRARHRHRRLDPLSGLCLRRAWPAAHAGPRGGL